MPLISLPSPTGVSSQLGVPQDGECGCDSRVWECEKARNWGDCAFFSLLTPQGPLSPPSSSLAYRLARIILKLCCLNPGLLSPVHPNRLGSCRRGEEWSAESLESWLHLSRRLFGLVFFIFFSFVFAFCFPQIILGHARSLLRLPSPHVGGEDGGSLWGWLPRGPGQGSWQACESRSPAGRGSLAHASSHAGPPSLSSFLPRLLLLLPILITWVLSPSPEGMFLSSHFPTLGWSPDSRPVEVRKCKGHLA